MHKIYARTRWWEIWHSERVPVVALLQTQKRISNSLSYFLIDLEKLGKNPEVKYENENYFEEFSRNFQNPNFFPTFLMEQNVLPKSLELTSI